MSNLDRRIARLEQALGGTDIRDVVARMTREERRQRMIESLHRVSARKVHARTSTAWGLTPHMLKNTSG
jgi:hypothetical protein